MATNGEQFNPNDSSGKRTSVDLLPRFFRSNSNKKFLNATLDQMIQPGTVKKVNGFIGRSNSKSSNSRDIFLKAADKFRQDYQLEPAAVIKDYLGNTTFFKDYIDHINHISVFGGNVDNHSRLNSQEFYSWNPHIDWDKFVNFQQYYWLPFGPDVIKLAGQQKDIVSTFTVSISDEEDNYAYLFTPNGLTRNPTLKLFRGQTYIFDIEADGHPMSIKRLRTAGDLDRYNAGVSANSVERGKIEFSVPLNAPDVLFYVSETNVDTGGVIHVFDIEENTYINVEEEIIGKKTYTIPDLLGSPLSLSNGMKVEFVGEVFPSKFASGSWYVEGVGTAIKLISEVDLEVRSSYVDQSILYFDDLPFDQMPYSEVGNLPSRKDYLTINRSSPDNNAWSRYNRWFHKDVIEISAKINSKQPDLTQINRAARPIIEFVPGIKLFNHGVKTKNSIDVIDNFTKDAFSTVEGSTGYNIDGIDLADGMRVIFNADTDVLVKHKVYRVNFITVNLSGKTLNFNAQTQVDILTNSISFDKEHGLSTGNKVIYLDNTNISLSGLQNRQVYWVRTINQFSIQLFKDKNLTNPASIYSLGSGIHSVESFIGRRRQIHLTEEPDATPNIGESVPVRFGTNDYILNKKIKGNQGQTYWFDGDAWQLAQVKFTVNQPPMFDVFDSQGNSYSDTSLYDGSGFKGSRLFSYKTGTGSADRELGFPISYQNINNVGDIVFNFDLLNDYFDYKVGNSELITKKIDAGYLKITEDIDRFKFSNAWTTSAVTDYQPVIRVYRAEERTNDFPIDVFSDSTNLDDLRVKVYLNGKILKPIKDYTVELRVVHKFVVLEKNINETDILTIKCYSKEKKNDKGYYEFPINLQNNPLNNNLGTFTLGEVLNHVETIIENIDTFNGEFPGSGNLRDLGSLEKFGTRFVQHSAPLNLSLYHLGNKDANIIKAIDRARDDYGKFKRSFLLEAEKHAFFGNTRDHVNYILQKVNSNKHKTSPYYLSDMFAYSAANVIDYVVLDSRIKRYPLSSPFNLEKLSNKAVNIYLNNRQLIVDSDYLLGDDEFFEILVDLHEGDKIEAVEWETTDGCFCPPTPTKLGIYPSYVPSIYIDYSYKFETETFVVPDVTPELTSSFTLKKVNKIVDPSDIDVIVNNSPATLGEDYIVEITNGIYTLKFVRPLRRTSTVEVSVPVVVIQGHDGSVTIAFNDYRDDLILELETRIFNNLKVKYNPKIFDILDYIPGYSRSTRYSRKEFNNILAISFFNWIQLVGKDFTKNVNFDTSDRFTYNHEGTYLPNDTEIPKYWRGIYRWILDTDRPDTRPWECLGFSIKPKWWDEVYGPAPYTANNFILWDDIKEGIIRDPESLAIKNPKVARPILNTGLPVDSEGKLVSPSEAGFLLGFTRIPESDGFNVGDGAPVEAAWNKSSYYPFSLIRTCILMNPSDVLGRTLDRSRILLNNSNQLIYSETGLRIRLADFLVTSTSNSDDAVRIYTAGLINYIVEYMSGENLRKLNRYKSDIKLLTNNLSTRLSAFTSKPKYRLLLDSKTPNATSGVFIPDENYKVEFNVSSPIKRVSYSGVMITKTPNGFEVKGYDHINQFFVTYPFRSDAQEITVGGISESYLNWEADRTYIAGKIVRNNSSYYRVKVTHKTSNSFDFSLYTLLPELPLIGGQTARLRKDWDFSLPIVVSYNTVFLTIQEVVDFLQGYSEHLKREGFVFDQFNDNLSTISDWKTSIKEFLFWTTQNWTSGSVISLSPAAGKLVFNSKLAVVDDVKDPFYDYLIYKVDGKKLEPENINVFRSGNTFELEPRNTKAGIYSAVLNLVQKEHVVIIDNKTIFNDVLYDLEAGFRQERLRILGYITNEWTGGFDIPGFLFDRIKVEDWEPWTDYSLGSVVRYKEFYYSAKTFLPGTHEFDFSEWHLIEEKLESKLLPNWDYRAEQFNDFYDLDTDNLDSTQQKLAQHLIGYQKRQYLENIINNDVSQYKFYQGMIAEKGTSNVLSKLFDALSTSEKESIVFNEEWAVRVGDYGSVAAFDEFEVILDEKEFRSNPQPLEIVDVINPEIVDVIYRQRVSDLYIKPSSTNTSSIFEVSKVPQYLRQAGYVRESDVIASIDNLESAGSADKINVISGAYIHTAFEGSSWNVYTFHYTGLKITDIAVDNSLNVTTFFCNQLVELSENSYIYLDSYKNEKLKGIYKVSAVSKNTFTIEHSLLLSSSLSKDTLIVFSLKSVRLSNIDKLNDLIYQYKSKVTSTVIWADKNKNDNWAAYVNNPVYNLGTVLNQDLTRNLRFGKAISLSQNGNVCAVVSEEGLTLYEKSGSNNIWKSFDQIATDRLPTNFASFGSIVKLSFSGEWLVVAAPLGTPDEARVNEQGFFYLYNRKLNGKYHPIADLSDGSVKQFTEEYAVHYGSNIAFSETSFGQLLAVSAKDEVYVYRHDTGNELDNWGLVSKLTSKVSGTSFGDSIVFADFNNTLVISDPSYGSIRINGNETYPGYGEVYIYDYFNNSYILNTTLQFQPNTKLIDADEIEENSICQIVEKGSTDFKQFGASSNSVGTVFVAKTGGLVYTHNLVPGTEYSIVNSGHGDADYIDWEDLGAPSSEPGTTFVAKKARLTENYSGVVSFIKGTGKVRLLSDLENFGSALSISNDSNYLAVGAKLYNNDSKPDSGAVLVYRKTNDTYTLHQQITSSRAEVNEQFGHQIGFMNDDQTLVIGTLNSTLIRFLTFDVYAEKLSEFLYEDKTNAILRSKYVKNSQGPKSLRKTTFDKDTTRFNSTVSNTGLVDVYDKYNTTYVYGETVINVSASADSYGSSLEVGNNTILVSAPRAAASILDKSKIRSIPVTDIQEESTPETGKVFSYVKIPNTFSWEPMYEQLPEVNVDKIKKAYLYNRRTNDLITYLDVVDVNQGKIPGIADQEIKFKLFYDPAIYTFSSDLSLNVDDGLNWTDDRVGQVWWDLSLAKFFENNLGSSLYKSINWNILYKTASIDIYEWVGTKYLPADWDKLADTEEGFALGISGKSKYGNDAYSVKSYFDPISKTVKSIYYFWVKNKKTVPQLEGRNLSADNISNLIADPVSYGYPCISINGRNSINLVNLSRYLENTDVVLNIQQWLVDNRVNYHSEWKLLSENADSVIPTFIEQKWFHSLIGKDDFDRPVPDLSLPARQRYGVEFKPRQSMFVNRIEPLKQLIERTNQVLKKIPIADTHDLSSLFKVEEIPNEILCLWDVVIDSEKELRFVSTVNFKLPELTAASVDGRIVSIEIINGGIGYSRYRPYELNENQDPIKWFGPEIFIGGSGRNAKIVSVVNHVGSVVGYDIQNPGEGYSESVFATVRPISVLVKNDETSYGRWSIYSWEYTRLNWKKTKVQSYDVTRYWKYLDWYKEGYTEYTKPDFLVESTYNLLTLDIPVNSVVKIKNVGSGGWSLLKKYRNLNTIEYTENFELIGRQNGTIKFLENIYSSTSSYDRVLLDTAEYDSYPVEELRIILQLLKTELFANEHRQEYIKLFVDSIRYVLREQLFTDWIFKTSFINAKHNVGKLSQKPTYKNDNLRDFESYIEEVKPYRTKIREYISNYSSIDYSKTGVNDFDLMPVVENSKKITPVPVKISDKHTIALNNFVDTETPIFEMSPWKDWKDNVGFRVTAIEIVDGGDGYVTRPKVEIVGDQLPGGSPASAVAYIVKGKVARISITDPGSKWISAPLVKFSGPIKEGGRRARATAIIGESVIRSSQINIKFDRLAKAYQMHELNETEIFSGAAVSGSKSQFRLKWSPDLSLNTHTVILNGAEVLKSEYTLSTVTKKASGSTRYSGLLTFNQSPRQGSVITVRYNKNIDHLSAVDRINFFYEPSTGQLGKDLSQLMTGVDYGGVSITGIDFKNGWDTMSWVGEVWDATLPEFEDHIVTISNQEQTEFRLPFVPKEGEKITVYVSRLDIDSGSATYLKYLDPIRVDSEDYPLSDSSNVHIAMKTFIGDGEQDIIFTPTSLNLKTYEVAEGIVSGRSDTIFYSDSIDGGESIDTDVNRFVNGQYSNTPADLTLYGDRVIFRKITSDGSIKMREEDYDTAILGGDLAYNTARGIEIDDISLDGDGLVSPMTSYAPEEVVPGQVMDTLSIKVFSRPVGGAPNIMFKSYFGNGKTTRFKIGQYFLNNRSIIVKVDDEIKQEVLDYSIDYENNIVELSSAPTVSQTVSIISISFSSSSILDIDYFISDGDTYEFITRAPWANSLLVTVLVNGLLADYEIFATNEEYVGTDLLWKSRVGIRLKTQPTKGAVINYIVDQGDVERTASVARSEVINLIPTQHLYKLINPLGVNLPYEPNMLVKLNNRILRGPSYSYFTLSNNQLTYSLKDSKYQMLDINASEIDVYLGGQKLVLGKDYVVNFNTEPTPVYEISSFRLSGGLGLSVGDVVEIQGNTNRPAQFEVKVVSPTGSILAVELLDAGEYNEIPKAPYSIISSSKFSTISAVLNFSTARDLSGISISLNRFKYMEGEKLVIGVSKNAEYTVDSQSLIISNNVSFDNDSTIEVLSFFNHNILNIERTEEVLNQSVTLDLASLEYVNYSSVFKGRITLKTTVSSDDFIWVVKNGILMTLNVDYIVEPNMQTVRLAEYPNTDDVIQIIAFTNTVVSDSFAFMQFKDITNRTVYKRLNGTKTTVLKSPLKPYDKTIFVEDATVLDIPDVKNNRPGIIEIYGERIEYFKVEGNTLSQLRRATLGTGAADLYTAGTLVQNIGPSETIPYKDEQTLFVDTVSVDSTKELVLPFAISKDEVEVFVGGFRLKKDKYTLYTDQRYPNSPEGDSVLDSEFTVDNGDNPKIIFTTPLSAGLKVIVVRKQGKIWNDFGKRIANSDNTISKFINAVNETWLRQ